MTAAGMANVEIILTGFAVVMGALSVLGAMTWLVGQYFIQTGRVPREPMAATAPPPAHEGIPAHHLVAIAAAVHSIVEGPHQIVAIAAPPHRTAGWAREGRFSSFIGPSAGIAGNGFSVSDRKTEVQ